MYRPKSGDFWAIFLSQSWPIYTCRKLSIHYGTIIFTTYLCADVKNFILRQVCNFCLMRFERVWLQSFQKSEYNPKDFLQKFNICIKYSEFYAEFKSVKKVAKECTRKKIINKQMMAKFSFLLLLLCANVFVIAICWVNISVFFVNGIGISIKFAFYDTQKRFFLFFI